MSPACCLDWIDISDEVSDRHVRRRKLFDEALIPTQPRQRSSIPALRQQFSGVLGDGGEGIVIHFAPGNGGDSLVEQPHELSEYPALSLTSKPEKDEVVSSQQGIHDLGQNRVFVAYNALENWLARAEP